MFRVNNKIINLNVSADHNFCCSQNQLRQRKYHSHILPVACNYVEPCLWDGFIFLKRKGWIQKRQFNIIKHFSYGGEFSVFSMGNGFIKP
jgi:hypothetical protein